MGAYSIIGTNATGTANKSLATVIAAATVRPRVYDIIVGNAQTPADQAIDLVLGRFTAIGTEGAAYTPRPLDPADPASLTTSGITHSAEPTYTANQGMLDAPINQRATFRWVASPGSEIIAPATANNGLGFYLLSATAAAIQRCTIYFSE